MKSLLWVVTILFFLLSWWWYVCPHKQVCPFGDYASRTATELSDVNKSHKEEEKGIDVSLLDSTNLALYQSGSIFFKWSGDKPYTSPSFSIYRDSILATLGEKDLLQIIGKYYADETNKSVFSDLGYARANKIKLLFRDLPSNRFQLESSRLRNGQELDRTKPFAGGSFRRVVQNASIREIGGKVIINFPHASDEMLENPEVNAYLDDLARQLKDTEEFVLVVGHTDNTASTRRNIALGWNRAYAIRSLLLRRGLPSNRIITESAGEAYPIAANKTEEGRSKNRRVEVTILKDLN